LPSNITSSNIDSISIAKSKNHDTKVPRDEQNEYSLDEISNMRTKQPESSVSLLETQTIHPDNEPIYYNPTESAQISSVMKIAENLNRIQVKKIKTLKRTFALKKIGYKVIPYEDETDSRYGFTNENVVFVNKSNSAYRAEAERGDEFLLRHIIRIVAEAIAEEKHPEGKDALELQNRLIGEAIKIHNLQSKKK
jgi:hypothetical protein